MLLRNNAIEIWQLWFAPKSMLRSIAKTEMNSADKQGHTLPLYTELIDITV